MTTSNAGSGACGKGLVASSAQQMREPQACNQAQVIAQYKVCIYINIYIYIFSEWGKSMPKPIRPHGRIGYAALATVRNFCVYGSADVL